jgi:hypothetical protein
MVTRSGDVSRGAVARNIEAGGRVWGTVAAGIGLWVTGQVGGARGYLESLSAGVRTGQAVADALEVAG